MIAPITASGTPMPTMILPPRIRCSPVGGGWGPFGRRTLRTRLGGPRVGRRATTAAQRSPSASVMRVSAPSFAPSQRSTGRRVRSGDVSATVRAAGRRAGT